MPSGSLARNGLPGPCRQELTVRHRSRRSPDEFAVGALVGVGPVVVADDDQCPVCSPRPVEASPMRGTFGPPKALPERLRSCGACAACAGAEAQARNAAQTAKFRYPARIPTSNARPAATVTGRAGRSSCPASLVNRRARAVRDIPLYWRGAKREFRARMLTDVEAQALHAEPACVAGRCRLRAAFRACRGNAAGARRFPGKTLVDSALHLPLVLPPVVVGYLLLTLLGTRAPLGAWLLHNLGIRFAFSWTGAALAPASSPFRSSCAPSGLACGDRRGLGQAAETLGAGPFDRFFHIVLPLALPGIVTGAITAFAASLGEFGAIITFVSNIPGETQTLPLAIYSAIQSPGGEAEAARLSLLSISLALVGMVLAESRSGARARLWADDDRNRGASSFCGLRARRGVSVAKPGVTALFGPSGAGKTTIANASRDCSGRRTAASQSTVASCSTAAPASMCRRARAGSATCSRNRACFPI
jgi:molybdate transport system permease protein